MSESDLDDLYETAVSAAGSLLRTFRNKYVSMSPLDQMSHSGELARLEALTVEFGRLRTKFPPRH